MATVHNDFHNEILAKLVGKLREGVVPWGRVWKTGDPTRMPTNYLTRKQYHASNGTRNLHARQKNPC
jgi:antirestriction protein ArdC